MHIFKHKQPGGGGIMNSVSVPCSSSDDQTFLPLPLSSTKPYPLMGLAWGFPCYITRSRFSMKVAYDYFLWNLYISQSALSMQERGYAARYPIRLMRIQGTA